MGGAVVRPGGKVKMADMMGVTAMQILHLDVVDDEMLQPVNLGQGHFVPGNTNHKQSI